MCTAASLTLPTYLVAMEFVYFLTYVYLSNCGPYIFISVGN